MSKKVPPAKGRKFAKGGPAGRAPGDEGRPMGRKRYDLFSGKRPRGKGPPGSGPRQPPEPPFKPKPEGKGK